MVDIIIRARDGRALTQACVGSIRSNTPKDQYRLILVQSGGNVYEVDYVLEYEKDVFFHSMSPIGAVAATNIGLAISQRGTSEHVIVMDNDTRVPDGDVTWLERFVAALGDIESGVGCVGATSAKVNLPQHVLYVPQTHTADWSDDEKKTRGFKENPQVTHFVSFCVLFHASVLREIGPWDERYDPGNYEDTDYAMQVREAGYQIKVAQSVYIHHDCHATFGDDMSELMKVNSGKFTEKWGPGRLWDLGFFPDSVVIGMLKRKRELGVA